MGLGTEQLGGDDTELNELSGLRLDVDDARDDAKDDAREEAKDDASDTGPGLGTVATDDPALPHSVCSDAVGALALGGLGSVAWCCSMCAGDVTTTVLGLPMDRASVTMPALAAAVSSTSAPDSLLGTSRAAGAAGAAGAALTGGGTAATRVAADAGRGDAAADRAGEGAGAGEGAWTGVSAGRPAGPGGDSTLPSPELCESSSIVM